MTEHWSEQDAAHAARQGWQLVPVYDTRGYFAHAVLPLEIGPHVVPRVWGMAKEGDRICQKALQIVTSSEIAGRSTNRRKKRK